MNTSYFALIRYEADENKVFDWKEPRFIEDEEGNKIQEHLNAKVLYVGATDTIENYVEVDEDGSITELFADEATLDDYTAALSELGVE